MSYIRNNKTFIIAELSANHNGDKDIAIETIKAVKRAGADAIKLQTYTADTMTIDCKSDEFKIKGGIWDGYYLYDLYKKACTPWDWHADLYKTANEEGLVCFSTPFDNSAVNFLEELNNPIYKIASFEITDVQLIEYVASKGKPVIISTGIATLEDIELAVKTCRDAGNDDITLLKCTSAYPTPIDESNLSMINDLEKKFNVNVGLSDHSLGITIPILAVSMGAKVIEKHFILNKKIGGPDASFSLDETEFSEMVIAVREAEVANGKVDYSLTPKMQKSRAFSRSLYVVENIKTGESITDKNIKSIRPGFGMHPKFYRDVLGKKARVNIKRGTPLSMQLLQK